MNYNKYNPRCNSGTKWSCGDDGVVGDDDDPNEARSNDDDDGDDFPPSGKEFPRQISPCRRAFLSLWFPPPRRLQNVSSKRPPWFLGQMDDILERGKPEATQGLQVGPRRDQGWGRIWVASGHPVAPLWSPFWLPSSSGATIISEFLRNFWNCRSSVSWRYLLQLIPGSGGEITNDHQTRKIR